MLQNIFNLVYYKVFLPVYATCYRVYASSFGQKQKINSIP